MRWLSSVILALVACSNPSPVARIAVAPASVSLKPGASVTLVASAFDAAGEAVDAAVTWSTSDGSIATVDGRGEVTAVANGSATVTAAVSGVSGSASVTVSADGMATGPDSDTLIETARAAGQLDDETALLYRVFAMFGDPRLPPAYAGDQRGVLESDVMDVVSERWSTLSQSTQDTIEPFTVPPNVLGSWKSLGKKPRSDLDPCKLPTNDPTWSSEALPIGGHVRVWYQPAETDQEQAVDLLNQVETKMWGIVTGAMGMKAPLSDAMLSGCNGGDGLLDIYLTDMGLSAGTMRAYGETTASRILRNENAPTFILLERLVTDPDLWGSAMHELVHASEWAYDVSTVTGVAGYPWLKEALAQEAIDLYDAKTNFEQQKLASSKYLDNPFRRISRFDRSTERDWPYGTYLFFQYVAKTKTPSVLGQIWAKTETTSDELVATDTGISGGLKAIWPKYALTLWNQAPVGVTPTESFVTWDSMSTPPKFTVLNGDLSGKPSDELELAELASVENVSVRFTRLDFTEENTRAVLFHNTFFQPRKGGADVSVQAMFETELGFWTVEDWSDYEWVGLCRDLVLQRAKTVVVVVASARTSGAAITPSAPFKVKRSNMPCYGFEGTAARTTRKASWNADGRSYFELKGKFVNLAQNTDLMGGLLRTPIGVPLLMGASATFEEDYVEGGCRYVANASRPASSIAAIFTVNLWLEAMPMNEQSRQRDLLGPINRFYAGTGVDAAVLMGTASGGSGCGPTYPTVPGAFLKTQLKEFSNGGTAAEALADGQLSGTLTEGDTTFTWSFKPLRQ